MENKIRAPITINMIFLPKILIAN